MTRFITISLVCAAMAFPVAAQDEDDAPSLMERGVELFLEGLLQEMEPALEDLQGFADEMEPAFRQFSESMGPLVRDLFDKIDDINRYELPEVLPNGDIIIRRKPDGPADVDPEGEIEI